MPKEYRTIQEVAGPLMLVRGVENVHYDELGEIELASGETRRCKVLEIDGNDLGQVSVALDAAAQEGKPKCIIAHTVKGKGVSFMENQVGWHGKAPSEEERRQALKELEEES